MAPQPSADETGVTADEIEAGRRLFSQAWRFALGSPDLDHLPPADRPEIAFAGRSNVGKSTLLNALVGQKALARASNTPGRTQDLNFFTVPGDALYLVDMPGYGFAAAPKEKIADWNVVLRGFLAGRQTLLRVYVLIDARHGVKTVDHEIMTLLDKAAVSYQIVLTKSDKIKPSALEAVLSRTARDISRHPAAHPEMVATSSETAAGIDVLRARIARLIDGRG